jgi:AcrR family transcriptional regulator
MNDTHRTRILDAAEQLLGRYGYRKMTVADLASEAGIGKGTVYLCFRSKEDAVLGTIERLIDDVCDELERIAATDAPVAERLREMLMARILLRFDRVTGYRESLIELLAAIRPRLLEAREKHFERETEIFAKLVPRRSARALIMATNHFLPYALSPAELGDRRKLQRDAADVIDLLVSGLNAISTKGETA